MWRHLNLMSEEFPVNMPPWIGERFPADQRAAVDYLRQVVDEGMLREIAEADYGMDVEGHFEALLPIWNGDELKDLETWFPTEVLELIRWSEPEDSEWRPGSTGLRGHKIRAFCCAVLVATPNLEPEKETLIQLIDSIFVLGPEAQEATAKFLTWRIKGLGHEEDRPFFAVALLAIIQSLETTLSVSKEQELADWMEQEKSWERVYLTRFNDSYRECQWLMELSYMDTRNGKWEALLAKMRRTSGEGPIGRLLAEYFEL